MLNDLLWQAWSPTAVIPCFSVTDIFFSGTFSVWQSLWKVLEHELIAYNNLKYWMKKKRWFFFFNNNIFYLFLSQPLILGPPLVILLKLKNSSYFFISHEETKTNTLFFFPLEIIFKMWLWEAFLTEASKNWNNLSLQLSSLMASCL